MSAPARAWLTAVSASRATAASLSTLPSTASGPQWPWSVYSHRHVSAIVTIGRSRVADARGTPAARCRRRPRPRSRAASFASGQAEQDDAADAEVREPRGLVGGDVGRDPGDAGHRPDRLADARARLDEERRDEHRRGRAASRGRARGAPAFAAGAADRGRPVCRRRAAGCAGGASRSSVMRSPGVGIKAEAVVRARRVGVLARRDRREAGTRPASPLRPSPGRCRWRGSR